MMKTLPIGIQDFIQIRQDNMLYVDKTTRLLELVKNGRRYFLSRPRRFGKSLTVSTLDAMFSGKADLFAGLAAEKWVKAQSEHPAPVLRFDMSMIDIQTPQIMRQSLQEVVLRQAERLGVKIRSQTLNGMFTDLIIGLSPVVVLIDEYDKPILDNLSDINKANAVREVLRGFYTTLKSCDEYVRFVFMTGISKFSKMGVFSAINNLEDISMDKRFGDIVGYTQNELEFYFDDRLNSIAADMEISREKLLERLKDYYDGFSFDGKTRIYNPFSILQCLQKSEFNNYWYESGSPSFIVNWMKDHQILDPEEYRHIKVTNDFISSQEIEQADAPSFLYQSGYLTIEKKEGQLLTLDYPNKEVLNSLSSMYLKLVYRVKNYAGLGFDIWQALKVGDINKIVELYNIALAGIPYDDFSLNRNEFWYRSMFMMLLRGVGIISYAEIHTYKGRCDLLVQFQDLIVVLEFKFAAKSSEVEKMREEGQAQLQDREYTKSYQNVITAVLVADDQKRQIMY